MEITAITWYKPSEKMPAAGTKEVLILSHLRYIALVHYSDEKKLFNVMNGEDGSTAIDIICWAYLPKVKKGGLPHEDKRSGGKA